MFHLFWLNRNQWLSEDALKKIQLKKLKNMIKFAYESVEYYRTLFDSLQIRPADIQTLEDFSYIPITTRQQFQKMSEKRSHTVTSRRIEEKSKRRRLLQKNGHV